MDTMVSIGVEGMRLWKLITVVGSVAPQLAKQFCYHKTTTVIGAFSTILMPWLLHGKVYQK